MFETNKLGRHEKIWVVIILLTILITLPPSYASLIITPNPTPTLDVLATQPKIFQINISNTHPFPIYNITFSPITGIEFPSNLQLEVNKSVIANYTINTNSEFVAQYTSKAKFNFYTVAQHTPKRYNISVNPNEFLPNTIQIEQGDTILWKNNGTLNHNIRSNFFDQVLSPNQTYEYTFNTIGNFEIQDVSFSFGMNINVNPISNQQLTNNPEYDKDFIINVNSQLIDTNLNFEIIDASFNIKYNSDIEGLIRITNSGVNEARNLRLTSTSNWITFAENNFSIAPQDNNVVIFKLKPLIFDVNSTNMTYNIPISVDGLNALTQTKSISVFIQHEPSLIVSNLSNEELLKRINDLQQLLSLFNLRNNTVFIYRDPVVPVENLTQENLYGYMAKVDELVDRQISADNNLKILNDKVENNTQTTNTYNSLLNETTGKLSESKEDYDSLKAVGFILAILGVLAYLSWDYFGKQIKKNKEKRIDQFKQNYQPTNEKT